MYRIDKTKQHTKITYIIGREGKLEAVEGLLKIFEEYPVELQALSNSTVENFLSIISGELQRSELTRRTVTFCS